MLQVIAQVERNDAYLMADFLTKRGQHPVVGATHSPPRDFNFDSCSAVLGCFCKTLAMAKVSDMLRAQHIDTAQQAPGAFSCLGEKPVFVIHQLLTVLSASMYMNSAITSASETLEYFCTVSPCCDDLYYLCSCHSGHPDEFGKQSRTCIICVVVHS